jgi:quercetin dioxygenase-like cupin family protein
MKILAIIAFVFLAFVHQGCQEANGKIESADNDAIFPQGQLAPAEFFTGNVWVTGLVDNDSVFTTAAGNVYFEAGARSNWHSRPPGQILIVTAGKPIVRFETD